MEPETFPHADWKQLLEKRADTCVSLYMPTHRSGAEVQQNPVRLKNLLREAESRLHDAGTRPRDAAELLAPAEGMLADPMAWSQRGDGLAIFAAPGFFRSFSSPCAFKERAVVGERFYVKPLSPLLQTGGRLFYVLALSLNEVRLLEGGRDEIRRVELRGVPKNFEEVVGSVEIDASLQAHSAGGPGQSAVFHGHAAGEQEKLRREVHHYFHQVGKGLPENLRDRQAPIVLAAVEAHHPIFRDANPHLTVLDEAVAGNPERSSDQELHEKAWPLVEPWLLRERDAAVERYDELKASQRASGDLAEVVPAAHQGRVDTLLLSTEPEQWGRFDPVTGDVELYAARRNGSEDLLDTAAFYTLTQGGKVYALEPDALPDGSLAAALFRY